ncbi:hypothetical protein COW36_23095 [bacterium (Candidatus Blackallbacteria) CG17_big_fil_post_rev_8_21_14_2_50_48_46]|uniref:Lipocalin-like domain-containing protein n=1 Tax=bacterium (Candidatus Blackallbacteria) CG17_big_fil_post_rev_8_21_14_2_50_48_46 TaxID=2014261 RepID=A0A2M7FY55_9BACT|nr:MAG: hypothetical protein COW64_16165 [bacterium (Candidatus Blackallbacteria) CG18_big_fil_WC_8_21_14_2_50_49_26]PIW14138.1 MAG: hypothetical protein COW36_23095 [bacterium (Candidatus Blackallbacteria) CG17_big_fil_post_rev_8_21_14_2_50_48_46]PIW45868.1 MAG: hypothetical protein COW20_18760 [bacterium (Candidatus Blackallbacteria) CG13_big_fil_rev_8_21_14_2_50_49_14]
MKRLSACVFSLCSVFFLAACSPSLSEPPVMSLRSQEQIQADQKESMAKSSFNSADLSGCWQARQIFPPQGGPGPGFMLRKLSENEYEVESGADQEARLKIKAQQVELVRSDGTVEKAETRFETFPYQIVFEAAAPVPGGWNEGNRQGWEWLGKTCS